MTKRWLKLAAVPVALSLVAAACGDDDDEPASESTEAPADEPADEPAADEPADEPAEAMDFGGATVTSDTESDVVLDEMIRVRFDASTARDMPWEFTPAVPHVDIRIGETGLAFYEAYNPTDTPIAGTASFNVAPFDAGGYFVKIACFCFEMQVLEPGERVEMPVTFYVDPEILNDTEARQTPAITLSYTFHVTDMPEDYAALDAGN